MKCWSSFWSAREAPPFDLWRYRRCIGPLGPLDPSCDDVFLWNLRSSLLTSPQFWCHWLRGILEALHNAAQLMICCTMNLTVDIYSTRDVCKLFKPYYIYSVIPRLVRHCYTREFRGGFLQLTSKEWDITSWYIVHNTIHGCETLSCFLGQRREYAHP